MLKKKSLIALLLVFAMLLSVGCAKQAAPQEAAAPAPEQTAEPVQEEPAQEEEPEVNPTKKSKK